MAVSLNHRLSSHLRDIIVAGMLLFLILERGLPALGVFAEDGGAPNANVGLSSAFAYQGRLLMDGLPGEGTFDFQFELFDGDSPGGQPVTLTLPRENVTVTGGVFSAQLDFGSTPFNGSERWLEVRLRPDGDGLFAVLGRTRLDATPYAIFAQGAPFSGVTGVPAGLADGDDVGWSMAGNAGTVPGTNFIGSTDDKPFEVRVNDERAFRIVPGSTPNIIGGNSANEAGAGVNESIAVVGATIAGGGGVGGNCFVPNRVRDDFGTVGGGCDNYAGGVGTGSASFATVAGGVTNRSNGFASTAGGGSSNAATGAYGTVPGGSNNTASGNLSFAAGSRAKATHDGSFVWADTGPGSFTSAGDNTFNVRASGGSYFYGDDYGVVATASSVGVLAQANSETTSDFMGVYAIGRGRGDQAAGVFGFNNDVGVHQCTQPAASIQEYCIGVWGEASGQASVGVYGQGGYIGVYGDRSLTSNLAGYFNGNVALTPGYGISCSSCSPVLSDKRAKTNIADLVPGLSEVLKLRPVSFEFLPEYVADGGKEHQGLLAQEVRELLPANVFETTDGMLGINYPELIPVLINAIQEQQTQIEALSAQGSLTATGSADGTPWLVLCAAAVGLFGVGFGLGSVRRRGSARR